MTSSHSILRATGQHLAFCLLAVWATAWMVVPLSAQQDPATDTRIIQETLDKIKEVEVLDRYIAENEQLKAANAALSEQVAGLAKQVETLTQELQLENERLRKQLVELPTFAVKSRLIVPASAMAVLQFGDKSVRIREGKQLSVPVSEGVWTLMEVRKISNEVIELHFPELDRDVVIYD